MAVSKLWPVTVRLATVLDYSSNPEKTTKAKSKYSASTTSVQTSSFFSYQHSVEEQIKTLRLALSRRRSRTRLTVKPWHRKCRRKRRVESSWKKQWESPCRKKVSPTKTLRSQRRKKALRPSEAPKPKGRLLTGVRQSRQIAAQRWIAKATTTVNNPQKYWIAYVLVYLASISVFSAFTMKEQRKHPSAPIPTTNAGFHKA